MDVERDAQSDQVSKSEPQVNSQPSGSGNSNDQGVNSNINSNSCSYEPPSLSPKAQSWLKSAQERTGFGSYVDYLSFYQTSYPGLKGTRLMLFPPPGLFRSQVHGPADRSDQGWPGTVVSLTEESGVLNYDDRQEENNIIEALCDPPKDASLQIILFDTDVVRTPTRRQREVFAYLGLVLELDPRFFESMLHLGHHESYHTTCYHPSHVTVGHAVATICHSRRQCDNLPDVILLARGAEYSSESSKLSSWYSTDHIDRIPQCPSFRRQLGLGGLPRDDDYIWLLSVLLAENKTLEENSTTILLLCLLPLFQLELVKIRNRCSRISESHDVYNERLELRNSINRLLNDHGSLKTYTESSQLRQCTKGQLFRQVEAELDEATANAERLESSLRDRLQLEVSRLGLEESKKSIDLSNRQIEEAKRVKIFTILAFVYVPLNLATSIFGMNIQQLNESGKSLWVFLLTAFVTLAATGCLWFLIELLNGYQNWHRRRPKISQNQTTSSYSIGERVAMVVWLLRHKHLSWMKESGAWWRIMVNDRERIIRSLGVSARLMSVGEYVLKYSGLVDGSAETRRPSADAFDNLSTRSIMRNKSSKT